MVKLLVRLCFVAASNETLKFELQQEQEQYEPPWSRAVVVGGWIWRETWKFALHGQYHQAYRIHTVSYYMYPLFICHLLVLV